MRNCAGSLAFRTAGIALPFKLLEALSTSECKLVDLEEQSSNQVFEILEDWNRQLKHVDIDLEGPSP